jgi:hypothetical protein
MFFADLRFDSKQLRVIIPELDKITLLVVPIV